MPMLAVIIPGIRLENRNMQIFFFTQHLLRLLLLENVTPVFGKEFIILKIAMNQNYSEDEINMRKAKTDDHNQQPDGQCLFSCCGNLCMSMSIIKILHFL